MKIVILQLERIRELNILQGPASVLVLQILASVLQIDANISLRLLAHLIRIHVASVDLPRMPLDAGDTPDRREHPRKLLRMKPSCVERANSARRFACDPVAIGILA